MKQLILLTLLFLSACKKDTLPELSIQPGGCMIYWDPQDKPQPICVLPQTTDNANQTQFDNTITITVSGPPLRFFALTANGATVYNGKVPEAGEVSVPLKFQNERTRLIVSSTDGTASSGRAASLLLSHTHIFPTARQLRAEIEKNKREDLPAQVQQALDKLDKGEPALSPAERAYFLGQLGSVLNDYREAIGDRALTFKTRELALQVLGRAMKAAHEHNLYSVEAAALTRMFGFLHAEPGSTDLITIISTLEDESVQKALSMSINEKISNKYNLSWMYETAGDNINAAKSINEVIALLPRTTMSPEEIISFHAQRAVIMQYLNNQKEANISKTQAKVLLHDTKNISVCKKLNDYNSLGWVEILQMQTGARNTQARSFLESAYDLHEACSQKHDPDVMFNSSLVRLNLARVALLEFEQTPRSANPDSRLLDKAEKYLREAAALNCEKPEAQVDAFELQGRLALLRSGSPPAPTGAAPQVDDRTGQELTRQALAAFQELEKLTSTKILTPSYRWAALVGQADAHARLNDLKQASALHRRAEALLQRIATGLPLTSGRQMFVAQFEAGTARHVSLLLEHAQDAQAAFLAIRSARSGTLRALLPSTASGADSSEWAEQMKGYHQLFSERERTQHQVNDAVGDEQEKAKRALQDADQALKDALAKMYGDTGTGSVPDRYRAPADDELLLTCYPLSTPLQQGERDWLCAAADSKGPYTVRRSIATWNTQEAAAILAAFAEPLRRAKRLTLLPYGGMREVVWETVPFDGQPLTAARSISYGLDLPRHPVTAQRVTDAPILAVVDPQGNLDMAPGVVEVLRSAAKRAGRTLSLSCGGPRRGGHVLTALSALFSPKEHPADAGQVLASLQTGDPFLYFGHAVASQQAGWDSRLLFADNSQIAARDILALSTVPSRVLLVGCETAVSDPQAPADDLGLTQAFLLRGSREVLATTRRVSDAHAALLLQTLLESEALSPAVPLADTLRHALMTLRQRSPHPDWDAFRVYQP